MTGTEDIVVIVLSFFFRVFFACFAGKSFFRRVFEPKGQPLTTDHGPMTQSSFHEQQGDAEEGEQGAG